MHREDIRNDLLNVFVVLPPYVQHCGSIILNDESVEAINNNCDNLSPIERKCPYYQGRVLSFLLHKMSGGRNREIEKNDLFRTGLSPLTLLSVYQVY